LEQSQILLTTINHLLKLLHVVPCSLWHILELLVRDCRKDAAEIKQVILDPLEILFEFFNLNMRPIISAFITRTTPTTAFSSSRVP